MGDYIGWYGSEEWQEIVFLISGDTADLNISMNNANSSSALVLFDDLVIEEVPASPVEALLGSLASQLTISG